jgi:hypothetical protein
MKQAFHRPGLFQTSAAAALLTIAVLACAQSSPAPQTQAAPAWQQHRYDSEGFSVSFPSEPKAEKQNVDTDSGPFELRSYLVIDGDVALYVGVCDYGAKAAGIDPDSMLQGAKNGALSNTKATLASEKKITLGIYHGIEFEADAPSGHISARMYVVGTTLYQTLAVVPTGESYSGVTRFLDSFQLIARATN